jgi:hypothetical protein
VVEPNLVFYPSAAFWALLVIFLCPELPWSIPQKASDDAIFIHFSQRFPQQKFLVLDT